MRVLSACAARILTLVFFSALIGSDPAHAQTQLKVLDWNTHHGVGTDGVYNLQRFVTHIARTGANVVSLNEVEKFTGWGNEDQPARYAALLRAATGATWHYTFAQRDGATKGQGNLILSTFPIEAANQKVLSYSRSVAMAQIVVNGTRVYVFSTHLDADSSSRRATQMMELKAWAAGFAQQHIYAGDFNAWPGASEIANMTSVAYDAWAVAKASSIATAYPGNEAGNTRNSRIDYIWYSKSASRLTLKGAQVFDTRDSNGVMPSDHRPLMATFQVSGTSTAMPEQLVALPSLFSEIAADYDGDGKADVSVYRTTTGESFISRSIDRATAMIAWGAPHLGDVSVPGDYDGDGTADLAVYRTTTGQWFIRYSSGGSTQATWGAPAYSDRPVPADYDGDGRTDIAVFRPTTAVWYLQVLERRLGAKGLRRTGLEPAGRPAGAGGLQRRRPDRPRHLPRDHGPVVHQWDRDVDLGGPVGRRRARARRLRWRSEDRPRGLPHDDRRLVHPAVDRRHREDCVGRPGARRPARARRLRRRRPDRSRGVSPERVAMVHPGLAGRRDLAAVGLGGIRRRAAQPPGHAALSGWSLDSGQRSAIG